MGGLHWAHLGSNPPTTRGVSCFIRTIAQRAETSWTEALKNGTPYEIEFRLRSSADGTHRWFLGRALPHHDATGAIVKWFGTCTDIHEQKLLQDALRGTSEALRRESVQKDEFLGVVSHELRTPLNAVFGWARLLQEDVLGEDERIQAVASIMRNAEAQARLIEDVLDITRIVNHKVTLDRKVVNLWHIATDGLEAVLPSADAKGVSIVSEVESHDMLIFGDSLRLQQAVLNLLTNAVKFTPSGGEVRLEVRRRGDSAAIIISDSGQGIAPNLLPHIFERFRQADSSSTRRHGGLGLGLSIAHQLVLLHGGTIEVESAGEKQGSRFTVLLPILAVGTVPSGKTESHAWEQGRFPG